MRKITTSLLAASVLASAPRAFANDGTKPRVAPEITAAITGIAMPTRTSNRGSVSIYPFASLTTVGMSFGVKNKDAKSLSSVVSNANRKAVVARKDAAGNPIFKTTPVKDAAGTVVGQAPTTEKETDVTAHYFAVDVDADMAKALKGTPAEGSKALIFRDL